MSIAAILGVIIGVVVAVTALGALAIEWKYRRQPVNPLVFHPGAWELIVRERDRFLVVGEVTLDNPTPNLEIMVPEVKAEVMLLSKGSLSGITTHTEIVSQHPDAPAREDGYWFAYIVKTRQSTRFKVSVEIRGEDLTALQTLWVKVRYLTYGPGGRIPRTGHVIFPLQYPKSIETAKWLTKENAQVLPVKTHLLNHLDDPVEIVRRYVLPHANPTTDIVTIGETPLAIVQGRWRDPASVKPGWVARRLCYFFLPTSSLATACGLQTLVDVVGAWRVFWAFVGGAILKVLGRPGGFYQLAGEQARLIDDVTGTLPPYDRFIVLGPKNPQAVVDRIRRETGLSAAVVDVNDLKAVKILAATSDLSDSFLETALRTNPAGNADEQTPLVLIRPRQE
ncbi:MAG: F420-0:Gamma-glutamyl ligase [Cyanobacteria bacterium SID2]|nr:F420-0:Gamma-glutamyl ligase [Cyanobacteria bacterium SID2]MBP0004998.1 F420-0:Gamma-glutamyl ligase [Cyanobacteria bacterium SBC]